MPLRALLVTSRVTFVPDNYDALVLGAASSPHIAGLAELDNRSAVLAVQSLGLIVLGAPRIGWHLLQNLRKDHTLKRTATYASAGKPVHVFDSMNSADALATLRAHGYDLIVNARTRCIFKPEVLALPRYGCINIHHGLLPEQRGTMCDLWSLYEDQETGFTVHEMNAKIDAGGIVERVVTSRPGDPRHERTNYAAHLARSATLELATLHQVLVRIANDGTIKGLPNQAAPGLKHRRNPSRAEITAMKKKGLRL